MKRDARPIKIDGTLAYVTLTRGYTATIDAADVSLVEGFNWRAFVTRRRDGSIRSVYARRDAASEDGAGVVYMHRLIAGTQPDMHTDHIDGNGINNARSNLRSATPMQNVQNTRITARNNSGVKGVWFHKQSGRWTSQVKVLGKSIHLGLYATIEEASAAYAQAITQYHGKFGRLA